jgi:methyltransferase-like protein
MDAEHLKNAMRLYELADEARTERAKWKNTTVRSELAWISVQLERAARLALTEDEVYGDAWAEAGSLQLMKYRGLRQFRENVCPR